MIRTHKYSSNHWITVVVCLCMALSISGTEWIFGKFAEVSWYFRAASAFFPSVILFIIALKKGVFREGGHANHSLNWYTVGVIAVLFVLVFQRMGLMGYSNLEATEPGIIQAIMFGYMGYWLARDTQEIFWLLRQIAKAVAIVGLLLGFSKITDLDTTSIFFPSGFMLLFVLFGYSWYLYLWLIDSKILSRLVLWFAACFVGVWVTFWKPLVFAASLSTIFTFWYVLRAAPKRYVIYSRIVILLVFIGIALGSANYLTSGRMSESAIEVIYGHFLRVPEGTPLDKLRWNDRYGASGGRLDMWSIALKQIREDPLFGGGRPSLFGTHIHNWYLDMLLWVGLIGAFPFFAGLFWWFRLTTNKHVLTYTGDIMVPCLGFIIGIMAYNLGGSMRAFHSMTSFVVLIMSMAARPAQHVLRLYRARMQPERNPQPLNSNSRYHTRKNEFGNV